MLSSQHRDIVKSTVPVLKQHGEAISAEFYRDLFAAHPALFNIFNPANQRDGGQARSLAASVLAYAANLDNLGALGGMVERIANKHSALEVQAEHYPIVGHHLLRAIRTVLKDAATDDIMAAWAAAYGQLADIMIGRERQLYAAAAWQGFKPFRVERIVRESETIQSIHLVPADGAPLPEFQPGQYLSLKVQVPGYPYAQIRQYSLSAIPNGRSYRISVRREGAPDAGSPDGLVSNWLHQHVRPGDTLDIHAPFGEFVLDDAATNPVVLLSGGSGITPVIAMLAHLAGGTRDIVFVHATISRAHHAFGTEVRALVRRSGIKAVILYENIGTDDIVGEHHDEAGRINAEQLRPHLPAGADIYYCGPIGFVTAAEDALDALGIPADRRHSEAYAPDPSFAIGSAEPLAQSQVV